VNGGWVQKKMGEKKMSKAYFISIKEKKGGNQVFAKKSGGCAGADFGDGGLFRLNGTP